MVIGICGGSGSGKTTLLKRLSKHFEDFHPTIFSMDNYYKPLHLQHVDQNGEVNFDLPTALNTELLFADFHDLVSGKPVEVIEYHFNNPAEKNVLITLNPSPIVIIEGLFLFHYEEIRSKLDYSIFVDVDLNIQLDRRLYRDQESRGYSREAILYQWNNHVTPCFNEYLFPYRKNADFVFFNDHRADEEFIKLVGNLEQNVKFNELAKIN